MRRDELARRKVKCVCSAKGVKRGIEGKGILIINFSYFLESGILEKKRKKLRLTEEV